MDMIGPMFLNALNQPPKEKINLARKRKRETRLEMTLMRADWPASGWCVLGYLRATTVVKANWLQTHQHTCTLTHPLTATHPHPLTALTSDPKNVL